MQFNQVLSVLELLDEIPARPLLALGELFEEPMPLEQAGDVVDRPLQPLLR
jgi:hypothetical protein